MKKEEMCENCGKQPAEELHTCPYKEDIDGDYISLCNCCEDCQYLCSCEI